MNLWKECVICCKENMKDFYDNITKYAFKAYIRYNFNCDLNYWNNDDVYLS